MRSEPSLARSRTRGQRTATGPMPVMISRSGRCPWRTSRWRPSSVSLSAWLASKTATSASTACASSARAPLRRISVSGSAKVPGWQSWKTLALVTAYHSFGGEVEASSTPTIRRLTPSCRHQLSLIAHPEAPLLIVEGEKDASTAGELGLLATTSADGANSWRIEDTRELIKLGVRKVVVCPDNDGPGINHGIHIAKTFQQAGVETRWLELPGAKDLSDWAPNQTHPDALLAELIGGAPLFDVDVLDWRGRLKLARPNAGCSYRGDLPNALLALQYEPRLSGCFVWNDFRHRVEVIRRTPWCLPDWWEATALTPVGHRALCDADMAELSSYLTLTYDFGACAMSVCRHALYTEARRHSFDELKDRIGALPNWDSTRRLSGWLVTYAGADAQAHTKEYLELVGSKYIMQVLHRALNPGAKADYSVVFVSIQGTGKDQIG